MPFKRISVSNFKSFNKLDIELGRFNVFIGANASGKSNFVQIFKFLQDIVEQGLVDAIAMQGGVAFLRNISLDQTRDLSFAFIWEYEDLSDYFAVRQKDGKAITQLKPLDLEYGVHIRFHKKGSGFSIVRDDMVFRFACIREIPEEAPSGKRIDLGTGSVTMNRKARKVRAEVRLPEGAPRSVPEFLALTRESHILPRNDLLMSQPIIFSAFIWAVCTPAFFLSRALRVFDLDLRLPKKAVPVKGRLQLEEDGSNLPLVLQDLLRSEQKKQKFSNLLREVLSFVDDIKIDNVEQKYLLMKLRETYDKNFLPPFCLSDGTINLAALIVILFFEKLECVVIEEPDRGLHPHLISRIVQMFEQAASEKQIIITTHSPEMVAQVDLRRVYLLARGRDGFSTVSRPAERDHVRVFLQNDIGPDRLFVDNLLGA